MRGSVTGPGTKACCLALLAVLLLSLGGADIGSAASEDSNLDILAFSLSGHRTNLTHDAALDLNPAAASDGRIVFLSTRDGYPNLYVMDGDGRNVSRLTNSPADGTGIAGGEDLEFSQAAWSPRGDEIAFDGEYLAAPRACEQHCASWDVMVVGADGTGLRQVALSARAPAWSPDGRRLVFEQDIGTYFDANGVAITRLDGSSPVRMKASNNESDVGPVWSPAGGQIAFQAHGAIYLVRADGRAKHRLAAGHNPTWSPDGRRLAFIDDYTLFTIGRNGKGRRRVSRDDFVLGAAWSPKSSMLCYLAGTTTNAADGFRVETGSADGRRVHVLARVPVPTYIWGSPVWTRDGKRILVAVDAP